MKGLMMKNSKLLTYFNGSLREDILHKYKEFIILYEAEDCEMERLELVIAVYAELLDDMLCDQIFENGLEQGLLDAKEGRIRDIDIDKFFEDNAELMDKLAEDD